MKTFKTVDQVTDALKRAERSYLKRMSKYDWFDASQRPFKTRLKLRKRSGIFVASNVAFDPIRIHATSYRWWDMVKVIGGLVVFNDYTYSSSTSQHQNKVRELMGQLGIKVDLEIEAPKGLQDLGSALSLYEERIKRLLAEISNPRSRADKNRERAKTVRDLQARVKTVRKLIAKESRHATA